MKMEKEDLSYLLATCLMVGAAYGTAGVYYSYDNQKQINETNVSEKGFIMNENDELCYLFGIGEHEIKISRNDALYHKIEQIDGYEIKEVEINGWRDNNKVTYVNTKPVLVVVTYDKDGNMKLDDFGTVYEPTVLKK